ncbi:MAG: hypothetical protein J3Q66DRAFT_6419 [Benniella sp.]|nr:MAG: hypothetical protein J3Q66DRAFT_6419 [Benniella sp.]
MEHTDKNQSEISRNVSRPSSKTIAMGLPEILHNVFSFLDQHTLMVCLQISRFWYNHGRTLAWRTLSISVSLFVRIACDIQLVVDNDKAKGKEKDKYDDRLQDFIENCHHIRSLTLTAPQSSRSTGHRLPDTLLPRIAGLKNLDHFIVKLKELPCSSTAIYELAGAILSQNPEIQEIEWQQAEWFNNDTFTNLMLKRVVGRKLKKITIDTYFRESRMLFLQYLVDANKERQKRLEQEQKQLEGAKMTTLGALMDESIKDEMENKNESSSSDGDPGFELEELILRDYGQRSKALWGWLYQSEGSSDDLPIRSLSFVNFEPLTRDGLFPDDDRIDSDDEDNGIGNSILPLLDRCPDLEKLCVSFDRHPVLPDNSSRTFLDNLAKNDHYSRKPSTNRVGEEDEDFVECMHDWCPKLREIEFGMFYQLTSDHWIEMMEKYRPQLESLSIWGNVIAFDSKAFMTLIGPPANYLSSNRLHALTRLNINGMEHLYECAWTALHLLPNLKEFRARDVPLDAKLLIEEDWICHGLEILEIFVMIPRRLWWQWSDEYGWMKGDEDYGRDMRVGQEDESEDEDMDGSEDNQDETAKGLKRRAKSLASERQRKRAREYLIEYIDTQVKVCKALGRLTQLRELRVEGERDFEFGKRDWSCLKLTLETGLEHLAPLRHNLERLIVSGLDESIGRKEVEWIARNWVHHSNSHWLEQHHSSSQSTERHGGSNTARWLSGDDDVSFGLRSKFKALIGISGWSRDAISNIKWLREQCPTLSVIEVEVD